MRTRTLVRSRGIGDRRAGFTLIELLVVLAIAATIGGLVGPNLWQSYQRANERLLVINYAQDVTTVRRGLMQTKRSIFIAEDELTMRKLSAEFPAIPTGWAIVANTELYFLPTGVTTGGQIAFESPTGRRWKLRLGVLDGKADIDLQ
ncbi:MAG: type II secretion system protein [Gammaproteobacteria bacterium]|jgi:prepilin-type N-terminal cleavage/methylation domain-containing protein|nr:type II secretion system protein [Gammaproteobacteria bacterium]